MRGIMEFDDYNYSLHNPYVLVEDPKFVEDVPQTKVGMQKAKDELASSRSGMPATPAAAQVT